MIEPVCVSVSGSQRELLQKVPAGLSEIQWSDIKPGLNTQTHYISGRVVVNNPLHRGSRPQKKIVLQEVQSSSGPRLSVFLLWDYAEQCQTIQDGAIVFLSKVHVEKCVRPTATSHPSQLVAGLDHSVDARIWFNHIPPRVVVVPPQPNTSDQPTPTTADVSIGSSNLPTSTTASTKTQPSVPTSAGNDSTTAGRARAGGGGGVGAGTAAAMMRSYTYTEMKDIKADSLNNIFGVVKFVRRPMKTNGTDYMSVVTIVDPTSTDDDGTMTVKLKCNLFHRDVSKLPDVKIGDIVRFHRLRVVRFRGDLQGQNSAGFSWLAWDGDPAASLIPKSSSPAYTLTDAAKNKVMQLRTWSQNQGFAAKSITKNELRLDQMHPTLYFDLVCQVVACGCLEPGVCWLLRVWDGTTPIYPLRDVTSETEDVVLQEDTQLCGRSHGYAYDVYVFDDHFNAACIIKPGDYVKFYNLHAAILKPTDTVEEGIVQTIELCLHRGKNYGRGLEVLRDGPHLADLKARLNAAALNSQFTAHTPAASKDRTHIHTADRQNETRVSVFLNQPDDQVPSTSGYRSSSTSSVSAPLPGDGPVSVDSANQGIIEDQWQNSSASQRTAVSHARTRSWAKSPARQVTTDSPRTRNRAKSPLRTITTGSPRTRSRVKKDMGIPQDSTSEGHQQMESDPSSSNQVSVPSEGPADNQVNIPNLTRKNAGVQKGAGLSGVSVTFEQLFEELSSCSPKKSRPSPKRPQQGSRRSQDETQVIPTSESRRCMQRTGTVILGHYDVKATSIATIISHKVPFNFRVRATVMGYQPRVETAQEFLRLYCSKCHFLSPLPADVAAPSEDGAEHITDTSENVNLSDWIRSAKAKCVRHGIKYYDCPQCSLDVSITTRSQEIPAVEELAYIYMVDFLIGEPDGGWLKVLLWGPEAVKFFQDEPPEHVLHSQKTYDALIEKLDRLQSVNNDGKRVIIECCVKSFNNDGGVWYNMFDTVLSLDDDE